MKYLLLLMLIGCGKVETQTIQESLPDLNNCKQLKTILTSASDSERHDLRNFDFGFLYLPYSFIGSNGANCSQQARWYMLETQVNSAQFEIDLQNNNPPAGCNQWQVNGSTTVGKIYIRIHCTYMEFCNNDFSICKTFQ